MRKKYKWNEGVQLRTTVVIDESGKILSLATKVQAQGNAEKTLGLV